MPERRDRRDEDDLETRESGTGGAAAGDAAGATRPGSLGEDDATLASIPVSPEGEDSLPRTEVDEPPTGEVGPGGGLDLESLPPRPRPRSSAAPVPPPAPRLPPGLTRPSRTVADDAGADVTSRASEAAIDAEREMSTNPGAGGSHSVPADSEDPTVVHERPLVPDRASSADEATEQATLADAGLTERQRALLGGTQRTPSAGTPAGTLGDAAADPRSPRSQGPVPASKFSRGTARDPVAGSAALRGSMPGARTLRGHLSEGQLLAERYELVRRLGKGGMGEVWQAKHTLLQGMRAIKVIKASISRDPSFRARFLSEGQTMMRVKHANVVEVTDLDETRQNRELFMVMEYLQGRTLHDAIRDTVAPLSADPRNCARIFRELAVGMQRIHDERIVHKDLKTDNVLLVKGEDGLEHPKVIDFGLAKRLDDREDPPPAEGAADAEGQSEPDMRTTLSGTLAYMAPEQFAGQPSSFQSDVYAYGVMLFECFQRGEYPMPRGSLGEYLDRHKQGTVPKRLAQARPDLDPFLSGLADRCLATKRTDRPATFRDVAAEIQWWLEAPERARRRKRALLIGAVASSLVAATVWGVFFQGQKGSVSDLALRRQGGGRDLVVARERTFLGDDCLGALELSGTVIGDAGTPSILVDGREHPADLHVDTEDGRPRIHGKIDLSSVPEGEHVLGVRVAAGAEPSTLRVVVDRTAPRVASVRIAGADGNLTNAENPGLWIRTDTPNRDVSAVDVVLPSGVSRAGQRDPNDPSGWTVVGLFEDEKDGEIAVRIFATDLAGNRSAEPFEYRFVRDRQVAEVVFEGWDGSDPIQVREPRGNTLTVRCPDEDVQLRTAFRDAATARDQRGSFDFAREFAVAIPDVPPSEPGTAGIHAVLTAVDRAGNERHLLIGFAVVADEAELLSRDGARRLAVRHTDDAVFVVRRSYALPAAFEVTGARNRDAAGDPVEGAAATVLPGVRIRRDPDRPGAAEVTIVAGLPAGEYALSLDGVSPAQVAPLTLVVDDAPPSVGEVRVLDEDQRDVTGGWCRTRKATIAVEVSDLALASVTLNGAAPEGGTGTRSGPQLFAVEFAREGANEFALAASDGLRPAVTRSITVRADWTDPALALRSPASGDALDDVTNTVFAGRCDEPEYTVVVEGLPGGPRSANFRTPEFELPLTLPRGDHAVTVLARDPSERRSAAVALNLHVEHREKELPDLVRWDRGVTADMRKVAAGDVVIDGRTQPVALVFLDRTEVTNAQYRAFLAACEAHAGGAAPWDHPEQPAGWSHVPPAATWKDAAWNAADLPVVNVAWWDAWAFAKWTGRRLPTEAEWVKAAAKSRDATELDLRSWPPIRAGAPWEEGRLATAEATGQKGPVDATTGADESPAGCLHMGGNASEWVSLPYAKAGEPATGVRGGSWWTTRAGADVRRVPAVPYDPSFRARTIGFRCAQDAEAFR